MPTEPEQEPLDDLSGLVVECLALMEDSGVDGPRDIDAIEDVCRSHPERADELRARMRALKSSGLLDEPGEASFPERLGDFRLLSQLGGGGMGVVYLAHQDSLNREVALKLIRPDQLYFPGAKERFRREVEIVAKLQHPGIVPVYTVGEADGIPFFAMERIVGCTLGEVLEELAGRAPSELRGRDLADVLQRLGGARPGNTAAFPENWPATCAELVRQAAVALDHAHQRGVYHRDVKPSNIMVTHEGRALLFDFGLSSGDWALKLTRTGSQLGSLPYMAPEQIDEGGVSDHRSDVYELGVTLFELLTLRVPFGGSGLMATRRAILAGDAPAIRALNPAVSRDLETICRKAMERDPARRYPTAAALARDLENALALRPIEARPAGVALHARRWAQRHPARAVTLVLGTLLVVGGPIGFAVQRGIANRRITAAFGVAEAEQARAEENLDVAIEAVVSMLGEVGEETLDAVPGMGEKRRVILERALALFEQLLPQHPEDPQMRAQQARLQRESGRVLGMLGRRAEADAALREAELAYRNAASPALPELATCLAVRAANLSALGRNAEAEQLYEESIELLEEAPTLRLATTWRSLSDVLDEQGRPADALAAAFEAVAVAESFEPSSADSGDDAEFELAAAHGYVALFLHHLDRRAEAAERYELALELLRASAAKAPNDPERQQQLLLAAQNYGALLNDQARIDESLLVGTDAALALDRLVRIYPYRIDFANQLVAQRQALGYALIAAGRREEALLHLVRAAEVQEAVVHDSPGSEEYRFVLAMTQSNLGNLFYELKRPDEAVGYADRAVLGFQSILAESPGHSFAAARLPVAKMVRAMAGTLRHEYADEESLEKSVRTHAEGDPMAWLILCITMCTHVSSAASDPAFGADERSVNVDRYTSLALVYLERALLLGYDDFAALLETTELEPILGLAEFRALLARFDG